MDCTVSESTLYLNLLNVLPLGYALPSLLSYVLIFYIILRHYRTAFYVLFVVNGLLEITLWSTNYFKARLSAALWIFPFYETLGTTGASVSIFFFINYSVPFAAKGTNLLLTLNRLTLIKYNKAKHNRYRQAMYSVASVFLLGLPTFGLNVAIAYSLLSHRRKRQGASNQASDPVSEAEMKLCIMTGVMFLTNVVGFVCQMVSFVNGGGAYMSDGMKTRLALAQLFSEDIHILSQPWMLIAMSSSIRRRVVSTALFLTDYTTTSALFVAPRKRSSASMAMLSVVPSRRSSVMPTVNA
ncbi:hypothetical protein AAVH_20845 [Aphelenchoides avenae]|nr:hypothetical protein AAVH_20845 [Aphelenchus avenae]